MSQFNKTPTSYVRPENQLDSTTGYKVHNTEYDLYQAQWKLSGKNVLRKIPMSADENYLQQDAVL